MINPTKAALAEALTQKADREMLALTANNEALAELRAHCLAAIEFVGSHNSHDRERDAKQAVRDRFSEYEAALSTSGQAASVVPEGWCIEPVGYVRHVHYMGIARNGVQQEAALYDSDVTLPENTQLYAALIALDAPASPTQPASAPAREVAGMDAVVSRALDLYEKAHMPLAQALSLALNERGFTTQTEDEALQAAADKLASAANRCALSGLGQDIRRDGLAIFDGPECSQDVRDAIEWCAATVDAALATPAAPAQPLEASQLREALTLAREYVERAAHRMYDGTNGQGIRAEAKRRLALIDAALSATPAPRAPSIEEALKDFLEAQDALDNLEYNGINAENYFVLLRRRNNARDDLDKALAAPASAGVEEFPLPEPAGVIVVGGSIPSGRAR